MDEDKLGLRAHIMTATPTYTGDVCSDYAGALALATGHCLINRIFLTPRFAPGFSLVEYGRNLLVAWFLAEPKFTHLFWLDSDLFFPPNALAQLVLRNLDCVCGVYPTKSDEKSFFPYTALGPPQENGLQEAERVPGGFLCMSRRCVETVAAKCDRMLIEHQGTEYDAPRFFDLFLHKKKLFGEDYIACARIRDAGFKVWVDTDLTFKHWGRKSWNGNLAEALSREVGTDFDGQMNPKNWKKNEADALNHVINESAAGEAGVPESGPDRRDAGADSSSGG